MNTGRGVGEGPYTLLGGPAALTRPRGALALTLGCWAAFLLLCVLVAKGATQNLDVAARELFRPDDVWGDLQIRVDIVVEGLKPRYLMPVPAVVGLALAVRRRSWVPLAYVATIVGTGAAVTILTKAIIERPDPHLEMSSIGSFPSGHVLTILVCLGASLLVTTPRTRAWQWVAVGAVATAMGVALLLQAAHWLSDVAGGAMLAVAVLGTALISPLARLRE